MCLLSQDGVAKDGLEDAFQKVPMGVCAEKSAKDYGRRERVTVTRGELQWYLAKPLTRMPSRATRRLHLLGNRESSRMRLVRAFSSSFRVKNLP